MAMAEEHAVGVNSNASSKPKAIVDPPTLGLRRLFDARANFGCKSLKLKHLLCGQTLGWFSGLLEALRLEPSRLFAQLDNTAKDAPSKRSQVDRLASEEFLALHVAVYRRS
jgi:hypothetical protein